MREWLKEELHRSGATIQILDEFDKATSEKSQIKKEEK